MANIDKQAIRSQRVLRRSVALHSAQLLGLAGVALLAAACGGSGDTPGTDMTNTGGTGSGGSGSNGGAGVMTPDIIPTVEGDPGRVGLHRLNNQEYNNTVRDLLADNTAPASAFLAEEGLTGFDNTADALGMTPAQFEKYFNAAGVLVEAAFANPTWVAANLTCTPTVASDPCVNTLLDTLGLRIVRRPLSETEKASAMTVYNDEFGRSADGTTALKEVLRAMVGSASFLYRVEFPVNPAAIDAQPLNGYEVASRLSYLHWSTMPDADLFAAAAGGLLADAAQLEAQVDRMLNDPRANEFLANFGGQWLDSRTLGDVSPTPAVFPTWSNELRQALDTEARMWFSQFVQSDRPLSEWFTYDSNFVNGTLATHYGYDLPPGADPTAFSEVQSPGDARQGFMGLGHFLTTTSFPGRTSPTKRAVWVLDNLLCTPPPPPPPIVPKLEEATEPNAGPDPATIVNVKARLEAHRADPTCASCHAIFDPLGLALESFDGIGALRTTYSNGEAIDTTGSFGVQAADGTRTDQAFTDAASLGALLATDARFSSCVAEKVFTYALGRGPVAADDPYLTQIMTDWTARGPLTIRNLIKTVVVNDTFRFNRGEL